MPERPISFPEVLSRDGERLDQQYVTSPGLMGRDLPNAGYVPAFFCFAGIAIYLFSMMMLLTNHKAIENK
jgi:hypothetical protein